MKRWLAGLLWAVASSWAYGCNQTEPGAGSNTNWLRPCSSDDDCEAELSCLCGVCTTECEQTCSALPEAVCARSDSAVARAQCSGTPEASSTPSLCLPACEGSSGCASGQFCAQGSCLQLAADPPSASGCVAGAKLELTSPLGALQARYGTLFAEDLYLPVSYEERPTNWTEPTTPAAITAHVTDPQGQPVRGCAVRFLAGDGSGSAFAEAPETDANGDVTAYWVAGTEREQSLSIVLVDARGSVASQSVAGLAYANDEGPQSPDDARVVATHPATVQLGYELPGEAARLRVVVSPATFPHHAFYSAVSIDGFFAGLQNTSDLDPERAEVPDSERVLIASVWNLPEGDAQQLYGLPDLECGPHTQDLGGIRCLWPAAWQLGQDYVLELQRTTLAAGETGPDYAALGYSTEPCASAAGCTDYTLFHAPATDVDQLTRVVAYRYQSGVVATGFGSFVQAFLEAAEQNSCLATPAYDATFTPFVEVGGAFTALPSASFGARYQSWHNEVCANYTAFADVRGFRVVTGGPSPLGRPDLPDELPRTLELP